MKGAAVEYTCRDVLMGDGNVRRWLYIFFLGDAVVWDRLRLYISSLRGGMGFMETKRFGVFGCFVSMILFCPRFRGTDCARGVVDGKEMSNKAV